MMTLFFFSCTNRKCTVILCTTLIYACICVLTDAFLCPPSQSLPSRSGAVRFPKTTIFMLSNKPAVDQISGILDEDAVLKKTLEETQFPLSPEELVEKAKLFLAANKNINDPNALADNFEFQGPIVGPLSKNEYLEAANNFKFNDAFPDLNPQYHHFRVDPFLGNRVWCTTYPVGTNTGSFNGMKPTNKKVECTPQTVSVTFNDEGKVTKFTMGYSMDRSLGNSGGLGGAFGMFYAIGRPLPFREAQPYKRSFRFKIFNFLGYLATLAKKK